MKQQRVLIIGMVWPEPDSSAAGFRMLQIIDTLLKQYNEITFASAAAKSPYSADLSTMGVIERHILLNDSSFDHFIIDYQPDIAIFDRFMIEEQYGWRLAQHCPQSLRILDTEDLHFLRQARQSARKDQRDFLVEQLYNETAKREIASILRCDLSLIISEIEMKILIEQFNIQPSLLYYLPFLEDEITPEKTQHWKSFEDREGFVFIGNFIHEPNWNTVCVLKNEIWPRIRVHLPKTSLNIYGAYPTQKVWQLHNPRENFFVHGRANAARETIAKHRVLLAPIQFGAGVKGKFIDAMQTGTPCITTSVGAEAMSGELQWNGFIEDECSAFCEKSVSLYQDAQLWQDAQQSGITIINTRYAKRTFQNDFLITLSRLQEQLNRHRQQHFIGQVLLHHSLQSTRYMALWIEEKNKKRNV